MFFLHALHLVFLAPLQQFHNYIVLLIRIESFIDVHHARDEGKWLWSNFKAGRKVSCSYLGQSHAASNALFGKQRICLGPKLLYGLS